jgi:hypothetical protein
VLSGGAEPLDALLWVPTDIKMRRPLAAALERVPPQIEPPSADTANKVRERHLSAVVLLAPGRGDNAFQYLYTTMC